MSMGSKKKSVQTRLNTVTVGDAIASSATTGNANANQEETPKMDISVLFAEMTKMGAILNGVATDVSSIKSDMTELKNAVTATQIRMSEAEGRISDVEDKVKSMAENNSKCDRQLKQLWARVDDQEN